jgi:putative ABC transport system permease protein
MSLSRFLRIVRQRLRAVWRPDALDIELDRELAFHLEQLTSEFIADGLTPAEARLAARRALGNVPLIAEQARDQRGIAWLHDFRRDILYGLRMLLRHRMTSCVIVVSLALGIGANTAVLSAIDAVVRARLLIPDAEHVVVARMHRLDTPIQDAPVTVADYLAWTEQNQSFASIGLMLGNQADFGEADEVPAERIQGVAATPELFAVLKVAPALGRLFTDEEARRAQPSVPIVLSHRLWQRRFAGSPAVIGTRFRLNKRTAYVVGVMPEDFVYPTAGVEYWTPLIVNRSDAQSPQRVYGVTARLKPGVTARQAEADLNRMSALSAREGPDRGDGWAVRFTPVREVLYGWTSQPLWTLEAAVALVLLVACTNVSAILLARSVARRSEITLRAALGASRGRIVRQLMTETVVLVAAGGALGVFVAWTSLRGFATMTSPPGTLRMVDVTMDARVVAVAAFISITSGLLFGIVPALAGSRWDIGESRKRRWREALVGSQIAVTFVLLIGAALLTRSFVAIITRDVQFNPERLLTFQVNLPLSDFMQRRGAVGDRPYFQITPPPSLMFQRVHEGLRAIPGALAAAGTSVHIVNTLIVPMTAVHASRSPIDAAWFLVTPDFLTTIGARVVRGRDLATSDIASSQWVVVVNESAARRLWPGVDPIGQQLTLTDVPEERPREVVGVVANIPVTLPEEETRPVVYLSYLQQPGWYPLPGANLLGQMTFMVRTSGDPLALVPAARKVVAEIDPDRPISNVRTMDEQLRLFMPQRADFVAIISVFAGAAMLLAAIGIYGIVSYTTALRTREIGVRMALGARAQDIVQLVGRRAMLLIGISLAAGLVGALALTQLLRSQLWEITPTDPFTYVAVSVLLLLVCAAAGALPTRRATTVDPTIALRCE